MRVLNVLNASARARGDVDVVDADGISIVRGARCARDEGAVGGGGDGVSRAGEGATRGARGATDDDEADEDVDAGKCAR